MQPPRIVSRVVVPADVEDARSLAAGTDALLARDPLLRAEVLDASGRTVFHGIHERHLEGVFASLRMEFRSMCVVGAPRVLYKEYFTKPADGEMKYVARKGGHGQYGHVRLRIVPCDLLAGYVFENEIVGGAIPKEFIAPVRKGVQEALAHGVIAGYPIDDVRVVLGDGSYHDVDSNAEAFRTAAQMAFRRAAANAAPVLLEPIVSFTVAATLPPEFVPRDFSDPKTSAATAVVECRYDASGRALVTIAAVAPYSAVIEYAEDVRRVGTLRSCEIEFDGYQQVRLDADEDRASYVGAPRMPRSPLRHDFAAVPEPEESDDFDS
jgi:elongation factor G